MIQHTLALGIICIAMLASGCNRQYRVDFTQAKDFESYRWSGVANVEIRDSGLLNIFSTPHVSRIELVGQDGRTLLILPDGLSLHAYIEVAAKEIPVATQPASAPAKNTELPVERLGS